MWRSIADERSIIFLCAARSTKDGEESIPSPESDSAMAKSTASLSSKPEAVMYLMKAEERHPPAWRMNERGLPDATMSVAMPLRKA